MTPNVAAPVRHRRRVVVAAVLAVAWLFATSRPAPAQGAQEQQVRVGGVERDYLIYVPPGVSNPAPLVMIFHGGGGNAEGMMRLTAMNSVADQGHFIVVYPSGVGRGGRRGGTWNIGGPSSASSADDVGFVKAILQDVERNYPIDRRRIYAAGWSMGGVFTYRLACEMSDTFAAIAPVAATMVEPNCAPRSPVAVLHIHGTADDNIPMQGGAGSMTGAGREWPPAMKGVDFWAHVDGCTAAETKSRDGPDTTCQTFTQCRTTIELCTVQGGGHAWPGMRPQQWQRRFNVYVTQSFPASERIWAFFDANPKR